MKIIEKLNVSVHVKQIFFSKILPPYTHVISSDLLIVFRMEGKTDCFQNILDYLGQTETMYFLYTVKVQ